MKVRAAGAVFSVCVAALVLGPGAAHADPAGLTFAQASPADVSWAALTDGVDLLLCNTSAAPVTPQLVLTGSDVPVGAGQRNVAELLTVALPADLPAGAIGAGACASVRLSFNASSAVVPPSTSAASVRLTATALGVGSAAVDVAVAADHTAALQGSFGAVTLQAVRSNPLGGTAKLVDTSFWLRYLGTPTGIGPQSIPVVDGTHRGTLTVGAGQQPIAGALGVPVAVSGIARPGTYTGTLELGGKNGSIPVTIVVADPVWWLLLLVLLGVLIALVLRLVTGNWRYRYRLAKQRRSVIELYAREPLGLAEPLKSRFPPPSAAAIGAWQSGHAVATKAYFGSVFTVDPAAPAFTSLCTDADAVVADADCWRRTFGPALTGLSDALDALGVFLDVALPSLEDPAIVVVARALLRRGTTTAPELKPKQATAMTEEALRLTRTIGAWRAEVGVLLRHMHWNHRLEQVADFPERLQLAAAGDALGRAVRELFDATKVATVIEIARGTDAHAAHRLLATVGAKHNLWLDDALDGPLRVRVDESFTGQLPERVVRPDRRSLDRSVRWDLGGLAAMPFQVASTYLPIVAGAVASTALAISGALVAFAAAGFLTYQALYVGKPFGSGRDCLAAIFAGVAAAAVIDAAVNGLNWAKAPTP